MMETINPLYIQNPESSESLIDQGIYNRNEIAVSGLDDPLIYYHKPTNGDERLDDNIHQNSEVKIAKPFHVKKGTKNAIIALSATLVSSTLGINLALNPLARPSISDKSFSLNGRNIEYRFKLSNVKNYECQLVFLCDQIEVSSISLKEDKEYEGIYECVKEGSYEVTFTASNNVDYKKVDSLYKVIIN